MKKHTYIAVLYMLIFSKSFSQCEVELFDDDCCGCYSQNVGWIDEPISGWSYSWTPATYLNNSHIYNPFATVPLNTIITYTLTVTAPGCGTFVAGTATVANYGSPTISPIGPITYYYQYEGTEQVVLTSTTVNVIGSNPHGFKTLSNWYKNGVYVGYGSTYTVNLTGLYNGTDYYYATFPGCGPNSNTVAITYHGCDDPSDYPVTIHNQYYAYGTCGPTLPATVTQPSPGSSPTYTWTLYGGNEARWGLSSTTTQSPTLSYNAGGTPPNAEGIRTRAVAANGTEIRMQWGVGYFTQSNCTPRMAHGNIQEENQTAITKTIIAPNPTKGVVTIRSKNALQRIEVYNSVGVLVKSIAVSKQNIVMMQINELIAGLYYVKLISVSGKEALKLIVSN